MSEKIKVVCVVGPTASGKTALAVSLAKRYGGEVISADSMQIYKGLHIASAAPDEEEKRGVAHHLIEFLEPGACFSAADYVEAARPIIFDLARRGKLPVVAGGTGLYIDSLIQNVHFFPEKSDPALRKSLEEEYERQGGERMLEALGAFDPETAARLQPADKRRIVRAFEVYRQSGVSLSEQNRLSKREGSPFEALWIGIGFEDRKLLYDRINRRVDDMLEKGLVEEARAAMRQSAFKGAAQAIGHKELWRYLEGDCTLEQAAEMLKQNTRRYAKRQLTWFKRNSQIHWITRDTEPDFEAAAFRLADAFLG